MRPVFRRELAKSIRTEYNVSIRLACDVPSISATSFMYQAQFSDENAVIADWLLRLTTAHKRWGFGLFFYVLTQIQRISMELQAGILHRS